MTTRVEINRLFFDRETKKENFDSRGNLLKLLNVSVEFMWQFLTVFINDVIDCLKKWVKYLFMCLLMFQSPFCALQNEKDFYFNLWSLMIFMVCFNALNKCKYIKGSRQISFGFILICDHF